MRTSRRTFGTLRPCAAATITRSLALIAALAIVLSGARFVAPLNAHAIDYLAANVSPAANFSGSSGNFSIIGTVAGGTNITFDLTFSVVERGKTSVFPQTITFGSVVENKPAGAPDPEVALGQNVFTFTGHTGVGSSFTTAVAIAAPAVAGSYSIKLRPINEDDSKKDGLESGGGVVVSFVVAEPAPPTCASKTTAISIDSLCVLYRNPAADIKATLTSGGQPLAGGSVTFKFGGQVVGTATTGLDGTATLEGFDTSALPVGDHTIVAEYAGDGCEYQGTSGSGTLGVHYMFSGYQQPINADGSSRFAGGSVPVKIKIGDVNGNPISDAEAFVFAAKVTDTVVGTESEAATLNHVDAGNQMRYDPVSNQYIFNWDVSNGTVYPNGTYRLRIGLGEGHCGENHTVIVSLQRKGKK